MGVSAFLWWFGALCLWQNIRNRGGGKIMPGSVKYAGRCVFGAGVGGAPHRQNTVYVAALVGIGGQLVRPPFALALDNALDVRKSPALFLIRLADFSAGVAALVVARLGAVATLAAIRLQGGRQGVERLVAFVPEVCHTAMPRQGTARKQARRSCERVCTLTQVSPPSAPAVLLWPSRPPSAPAQPPPSQHSHPPG